MVNKCGINNSSFLGRGGVWHASDLISQTLAKSKSVRKKEVAILPAPMLGTGQHRYTLNYVSTLGHWPGNDLHEGDVILNNHSAAGGNHLPDLTIMVG